MATQPTKDKIISSSWELLEELPLTEFSMRKLASRLGMTVSSLYYHFSSKEALFAALIDKASLEIIFPWSGIVGFVYRTAAAALIPRISVLSINEKYSMGKRVIISVTIVIAFFIIGIILFINSEMGIYVKHGRY